MYRFTVMFENMPVANVCVSDDRKEVQIEKLVADSIMQPFSASLESQARELNFGLKVDYDALDVLLQKEPDSRALKVLRIQLEKYKTIIQR